MTDLWTQLFSFQDFGELVVLVRNSIIAGAVLGLVGGLIGPFVITRNLPFAVHGISELSFAGASAALLIGANVVGGSVVGSVVAALLIGLLGSRARERNSIIAVLMPAGLGLGILFLALYRGRSANKFGLLTGQIVSVDNPQLGWLIAISAVVIVVLLVIWRPLTFASVDPDVAAAAGIPVRALGLVFMLVLGLAVAVSVQIVGALLVLALLVTPAAAALRLTVDPRLVPVLSVVFAVVSVVGGILLALGGGLPISPYVTTISFLIWLVCRIVGGRRESRGGGRTGRGGGTGRPQAAPVPSTTTKAA
ncbi:MULTISPECIES: metal ABC transporter permease [unclassified Frigoribacterium]|uniref:metal ABC transporter permease n=1 Tax=unclassified Frigoribacterium TaxID=2627005 RepID=UPI000F482FB0|nr:MULTISPECIES: metal ABC transporter permease [unclassified Frigoribacterium]ROP73520.1 zinc/manganese transport system permease protein [Frigoribacterium sp. PhB107]TDT63082.1 zinc/manganese transport system permease protein [Frigoribacterium sp. PhB116]